MWVGPMFARFPVIHSVLSSSEIWLLYHTQGTQTSAPKGGLVCLYRPLKFHFVHTWFSGGGSGQGDSTVVITGIELHFDNVLG